MIHNTHFIRYTVYAEYENTDYKNMPVIRTLSRFTESFVFYDIEFVPDIRPLYWKTVTYIPVYFMPVIRKLYPRTFRI